MIKAIIFDNFGVLVDRVFGSIAETVPRENAEKISSINRRADLGEITNAQRDELVAPLVDGGLDLIESYYQRARMNYELLDLILRLKNKYKIGLLSNAGERVIEKFFSPEELEKYFDDTVLSYQVHVVKPYPEIYKLAAHRLGVETSDCVFVDDQAANIVGARAVGMRGVVYENFEQLQRDLAELGVVVGEDSA